jgi:selenide,water dikinase
LGPEDLSQVLGKLPRFSPDDRILVGFDKADDAAAFRLSDGRILLQSTDFFTPIVDDPYQFGQIAAANAISDIYAMGGQPLFALNIVGFPRKQLPLEVLTEILRGGMEKAHEAGIHIVGGHTIDDIEPKYGMVVTGEVSEEKLIRNDTAQTDDNLILTKPLGTGIIGTAIKSGNVSTHAVVQAIESMSTLNRAAAEAVQEVGVHAMTDVTGFGLLGHLLEMCTASHLQATVEVAALPLLPDIKSLVAKDAIPGGTRRNLAYTEKIIMCEGEVSQTDKIIAADAQTSGGLLIAVAPDKTERLITLLNAKGVLAAALIGAMSSSQDDPRITLKGH